MKLQDLTGFNNTGNICVWPSEEVLGGYCLENQHLFYDKQVLELGGGMTGLAGLMIAQACSPKGVLISDGNVNTAENLDFVINENKSLGLENVSTKVSSFTIITEICQKRMKYKQVGNPTSTTSQLKTRDSKDSARA
jgi:predicted nicotinamide N-methyase